MRLLLIYNIMCQWIVHHEWRFSQAKHLVLPSCLQIIPAVRKFHLAVYCFWKYSLDFIEGACQVDSEVMEALWAELDGVAGFVRGMSASHRQEVLDDIMINSNWKKLVGMPKFLMVKLDRAQSGLTEMKEALDRLSKSVGSEWVKEWEREEKEAFADGGIGAQIYEAAEIKSKPHSESNESESKYLIRGWLG